jgi:predicted aminopeptidase
MGGVSAYSTLGKFSDPVLSTMMKWDDVQLIAVLFHELAHQLLYIKDDTGFNESFATAVEEVGVERFLEHNGMAENFDAYLERKAFRRRLMVLVEAARADLQTYYAETIDPDEKRLLKEHRIERLTSDVRAELSHSGRDADAWLSRPFNNARIVSFTLYEGRLPAFRAMLAECNNDLECFYAESRRVSALDKTARDRYFEER